MPSHTETASPQKEIAPEWVRDWHELGNNGADVLASVAAELHGIPQE